MLHLLNRVSSPKDGKERVPRLTDSRTLHSSETSTEEGAAKPQSKPTLPVIRLSRLPQESSKTYSLSIYIIVWIRDILNHLGYELKPREMWPVAISAEVLHLKLADALVNLVRGFIVKECRFTEKTRGCLPFDQIRDYASSLEAINSLTDDVHELFRSSLRHEERIDIDSPKLNRSALLHESQSQYPDVILDAYCQVLGECVGVPCRFNRKDPLDFQKFYERIENQFSNANIKFKQPFVIWGVLQSPAGIHKRIIGDNEGVKRFFNDFVYVNIRPEIIFSLETSGSPNRHSHVNAALSEGSNTDENDLHGAKSTICKDPDIFQLPSYGFIKTQMFRVLLKFDEYLQSPELSYYLVSNNLPQAPSAH